MLFSSWLRHPRHPAPVARRHAQLSPRPRLEALDDRWLPSGLPYPTAATVSQLVADITYASKAGGGFTITLKPGTIFDVKSANNTTDGPNGLPVVGGGRAVNLTIVGNGDTIERVGGFTFSKRGNPSNPFRLFDVTPGASLTLQDVTLRGGWAYGSVGGGVYNQGTLVVGNCTVSTMSGGGIYNAAGTVTVSDSTVSDISGSGIANAGGTVTVTSSALSGNAAAYGGGISNNGGVVTVSDSTLSHNSAGSGGAIYNAGGTLTVSNSTLSDNAANYGGAIYTAGGTVTVSDSTLSGNSARPDYSGRGGYGGGVYNAGGAVTIRHSTLSGNAAYQFGSYGYSGGIYNDAAGTVTVENSSSVTGNTASGGGDDGAAAEDVLNLGMLYLDGTSAIGVLDGDPALPI